MIFETLSDETKDRSGKRSSRSAFWCLFPRLKAAGGGGDGDGHGSEGPPEVALLEREGEVLSLKVRKEKK